MGLNGLSPKGVVATPIVALSQSDCGVVANPTVAVLLPQGVALGRFVAPLRGNARTFFAAASLPQGVALGWFVAPLRGKCANIFRGGVAPPGRCPGLICCGPFGASTPCGARFCRMNRAMGSRIPYPGAVRGCRRPRRRVANFSAFIRSGAMSGAGRR
jgi:hypothetical protein